MVNEVRTVCYDTDLKIEAYRFEGIMQKFPNHFHDYYVIGFIENGQRYLLCNNKEYIINPGDITIFNPRDTHTCEQVDGKTLDYRCINIKSDIMLRTVFEITRREYLPKFTQSVLYHNDIATSLRELHLMILNKDTDFKKEELFLFLIEQLIQDYSDTTPAQNTIEPVSEIKAACDYLELNYTKTIALDDLSTLAGLSKYHFIRSFTRQKGISPYSYLETIRISNAKKLLEQGIRPIEVAFQTGFSDQSHFTNFFKKLIGLTPKQYMRIFIDIDKDEHS
ncbi:AraC-like DNA-binding protein [Sedimentibacter acidaminivorans]|uniref:AraC-like DNA-binding protein n=1 Tax=Sedimentibacter acidaminivorans TaxID=913099 RepID=A0ABS4GBM1_9FIRM|nr:AraC family transcriptional regulator [Sedimentibacter acidaminivorans]MBP1925081.1 AraC-like DNA-binding protein [Sedimentibacter acidaminivorans]